MGIGQPPPWYPRCEGLGEAALAEVGGAPPLPRETHGQALGNFDICTEMLQAQPPAGRLSRET